MNTEDGSGRFVFSAASKRRLLSNLNREQSLKGILLKLFDLLLFQWGPSYFSARPRGLEYKYSNFDLDCILNPKRKKTI